MMKNILSIVFASITSLSIYSQVTIAIENFDGGTPSWTNDIASQACVDPSDADQGLFIQMETTNANFVGNVAHGQDLKGEGQENCLALYPYVFTFTNANVTGFTNVIARFDYAVEGNNETGSYEWIINGVSQGEVEYYNDPDVLETGRITLNVGTATTVGLILRGSLDGANDILDFDNFVIEGTSTVPVTYSYITLKNSDGANTLTWTTASEVNNNYFDIEHSLDGDNFIAMGRVEAKSNARAQSDYQFIHENPIQGMHYYRLRQVDLDGSYAFSEVKKIDVVLEGEVTIYPTMVQDKLTIRHNFSDPARVSIYNMSGMELIRYDKVGSETTLDASTLTHNVYIIHVTSGKKQVTKKIIKQ